MDEAITEAFYNCAEKKKELDEEKEEVENNLEQIKEVIMMERQKMLK